MTPRTLLRAAGIAASGLLLLSACGADDDAGAESSATTERADPEAFPVTLEHKYGETTIEDTPERIVVVGLTEQDALLALGIVPVATTEWFGEHPGAIWPWAQDELAALGADAPEVIGDATAVNAEAVAAQRPDLILAVYSGLTEEDYATLSAIAPTVAQPADHVDYGVPWQELTRTVGAAVGQAGAADALVAEVEAQFATVIEEHPEFVGASAVMATPYEGIYVYGPEDARGRFLTALGFDLPDDLVDVTGEQFGGKLSLERADLLDVDAIVWLDAADAEGPLGGPVYETMDVHTEGREVHLNSFDSALGGATSFVSVLGLPFLLDGIVPMLAAAVDGDPATAVPTS